jgi:hypothetical protein
MNKKIAADIDPRALAADFFRKLGGMDGMTKWGRTHRSLAYGLISKLLAQPTVQNNLAVSVNVNGEAARRKIEDELFRIIQSRKHFEDPAVVVDGERLIEHSTRDGISHTATPVTDEPRLNESLATHSRPVTADPPPVSPDPRPRPAVQSFVPGQVAGLALDGNADDHLSTTEKFLRWNGHGRPP